MAYRFPSTANGLTVAQFLREFSMLLEHLVLLPADILILGDVNFHVDNMTSRDAHDFMHLLDTFNLVQHVAGSTDKSGHTLDLLISRHNSSLVKIIDIFLLGYLIIVWYRLRSKQQNHA